MIRKDKLLLNRMKRNKKLRTNTKCPNFFNFFCPVEKINGEFYLYIPKWILRAMRKKEPLGYMKVTFSKGKGMYNGYTFDDMVCFEKEIRDYFASKNGKRLRKKLSNQEKLEVLRIL